ncbi:hypothetical protein ACLI4R_16560 [Natrialbaceae archaeon A-chndr2]
MNTVANTVPSGSEGEGGLSRDEMFTMLSNRRRRWVLYYLKRHEGNRVDLRTLVDTISAWEYGTSVEALSWKQRKRVYTALRQSHLPKLDDAGIVKYDQSRGTVELTESAHEVQLYLEYVPAHDIPWSQYYLGLTLVGAALVVLAWGPIYPFDGLSGLVLASMVLVMFGISALVHHYHLRQHKLGARDVPPEISNA